MPKPKRGIFENIIAFSFCILVFRRSFDVLVVNSKCKQPAGIQLLEIGRSPSVESTSALHTYLERRRNRFVGYGWVSNTDGFVGFFSSGERSAGFDLHLELFMSLATNMPVYPQWTAYLKHRQPRTLIVWGRNDPLILPTAAEFVKQVVPAADPRYFGGGHFVLGEYAEPIAEATSDVFSD